MSQQSQLPRDPNRQFTPVQRRWRIMAWLAIPVTVLGALLGFSAWHDWNYPQTVGFGATIVAKRVTFERYETEYNDAVTWLGDQGVTSEYYYELPEQFVFLTSAGLVGVGGGAVFFPLWMGVPDDAGGYWYTGGTSPEGWDMYGMLCTNPIQMNEEWWACGLAEDSGKLPRLDSNQ